MPRPHRSEEHTSELQSLAYLVCRLLLEKKNSHYSEENVSRAARGALLARSVERVVRCRYRRRTCCIRCTTAVVLVSFLMIFFFKDTATTKISTLSQHDALPI